MWTGYPTVFGSVFSTLAIPIFVAAIGIVFRGLAYTLQNATMEPRQRRLIDMTFAVSSIITPYMLGTVIGAIASGRVPVGNAAGDLVTSWVNPTSILAGCLAVVTGAFLAAVYLAADARRHAASRARGRLPGAGLFAGAAAGALAIAGLVVEDHDAHPIYNGLTTGWGLAAVIVSGVAGITSLGLAWTRRYGAARASAALAVAATPVGMGRRAAPGRLARSHAVGRVGRGQHDDRHHHFHRARCRHPVSQPRACCSGSVSPAASTRPRSADKSPQPVPMRHDRHGPRASRSRACSSASFC